MRKLWPVALALLFGWSATAAAQSLGDPYGADGDDGVYGSDDDAPFFRDPTPEPPPPPAASPYHLLPSDPTPAPAEVQQTWTYAGPHAISEEVGGGWCNIQGTHQHEYPPFDQYLFQERDGAYYFVGDPADFGYTGDLYWYSSPHPIATGWGFGWCYATWPHRHLYAPFGVSFSMCGPYWCYTGPFDAWFWYYRPSWGLYWTSYYPRYYRGGRYHHTGVPAAPTRWVGSRSGSRPGYRPASPGHPAGRPGGYARPAVPRTVVPRSIAPRRLLGGSKTLYHRLPANSLPARRGWRSGPSVVPRGPAAPGWYSRGRPGPTPAYRYPGRTAPRPGFGAPRGAPSYRAPSYRAPSYRAPSYRAPSYRAPSYRAPHFSAPRPATSHSHGGGRSFGGRRR